MATSRRTERTVRLGGRCLAALLIFSMIAAGAAQAQSTRRAAFVANDGNLEGSVTSVHFTPAGAPRFVDRVLTPDTNPASIALTPNGRYLATGHASSDAPVKDLTILRVAPDAKLSVVTRFVIDSTPLQIEWIDNQLIAVTRSQAFGDNEVVVYEFDPQGPTLTFVDREPIAGFCTAISVDRPRQRLYTQDTSTNTVYSFDILTDGSLDLIDTQSTGGTYPLDLALTPGGKLLYGSGGISNGGNKINGLAVAADGTLQTLAGSPFVSPGASPADVIVTPDEAFLVVGHGTDATVRTFEIDLETGVPTYTGNVFDVGLQGSIGGLAVMDDLLLVTDNTTAIDGIAGLYSFTIGPTGALSQNGALLVTQGSRPEQIAPWSPCPGDTNGDRIVTLEDLAVVLANFDSTGDVTRVEGDLNGDGVVDLTDLAIVLAQFGTSCP